MNPQPDQDLERRLQQLEAELTPPPQPPIISQPQKQLQPQPDIQLQVQFNKFITWFNGLPGFGKLIVVGVAAIVGLAIVRVLLKLVSAVISLAFLAVLLYFGYQFFVSRSSENKQ